MKKQVMIPLAMIFLLMFIGADLTGNSADDYKVIKKAVKSKKISKDVTYFKILVKDNVNKKEKVRITLPITLVEMISECSDDSFKIGNRCRIDLKTILKELKKMGPHCLIEVNEGDETIKIWFE